MHAALDLLGIQFYQKISEIPAEEWDNLNPKTSLLLKHSWLSCLEISGSISPETDWHPYHAAVYDKKRLIAAMPLYIRYANSEGEFVFDYPWIQAAEQLGLPYFPKLVGMSPATPIPSQDILIDDSWCYKHNISLEVFRRWFLSLICDRALEEGFGSVHLQFTKVDTSNAAKDLGFGTWEHFGFRWENRNFQDFNAFLDTLTKDRRRNARRERKRLSEAGVHFKMYRGSQVGTELLEKLYQYYVETTNQFGQWTARYLNHHFFVAANKAAGENLLVCAAYRDMEDEPIGLSLLIIDDDRLLGRYWGCREQVEYLHFACCYYEPIEWAIKNNISCYNPGMGGEHKIHRGFLACSHYSHHWFREERMRWIFHTYIHQFNDFTKEQILESLKKSPLKQYKGVNIHAK